MNQGKFVYSQLTDFLPQRIFDRLVHKYNGNKHVRHFSCWNQLLSMIFGQLTGRDSLRDLMISIEPHKPKYYHWVIPEKFYSQNRCCQILYQYVLRRMLNLKTKNQRVSLVSKGFAKGIKINDLYFKIEQQQYNNQCNIFHNTSLSVCTTLSR